jgi:hypothetical protein
MRSRTRRLVAGLVGGAVFASLLVASPVTPAALALDGQGECVSSRDGLDGDLRLAIFDTNGGETASASAQSQSRARAGDGTVRVNPFNTCRRSFCPVEVVIDGKRYTVWQPCTVCDPILV